ncbi:MAG: hypothetical protein BWK76_06260 [Desulfobulbaceae bacterium A2]|nr:MAG: hypothetical protein BWK76_06260 [Desulfobulbaceae bacterium A2]
MMSILRVTIVLLGLGGLFGCGLKEPALVEPPAVPRTVEVAVDDPACAYFYFLWGKNAELHQNFDEAREAYEKALICDAGAAQIMQSLGVLLLRMGQIEDGVVLLEKFLDLRPEETRLRAMVAKLLLDLGRKEDAMRRLEELHRLEPDDMRVLLMQASILAMDQQWDEAEKVLAPLIRQADRPEAYVLLARMQRKQRRYDQALAAYERALLLGRNPEFVLELAGLHQENQHLDRALLLYEELLQQDPHHERALLGMVQVCLANDQAGRAIAEAARFRRGSRPSNDFELTLAQVFLQGRELAEARKILQRLLRRSDLSEARYLLAILLAEQEDLEPALQQLAHIPAQAPEYARAMLLRGRIHIARGESPRAIETLFELIRTGPADSDVYALLSSLLQREQRGQEAEALLRGAMEERPDEHDLRYEYGMLLERQGRRDEALAAMEELIGRNPEHAGALNYIGYSWADANIRLELALEYIQRALTLDPDNGYIRDSLGWVYFRLGKLQQARRELEKSIEVLGNDPYILDHLGDVYHRLGLREQARERYLKAVEQFEDETERVRVQAKVQALDNGG